MSDYVSVLRTLADKIEKNNIDLVFTEQSNRPKKEKKPQKIIAPQQLKHIKDLIQKEFY